MLRDLFAPLAVHLAVESILAGSTPGRIVVDDPSAPRAGLAWFHSRVFLAGAGEHAASRAAVSQALQAQVLPEMRAAGRDGFVIFSHGEGWQPALDEALAGLTRYRPLRQHYVCTRLSADWRPLLPAAFELRQADRLLLEDSGLKGLEALREEMVSERPTVEDFLERSFGVCLVQRETRELAGWCLSEYNTGERCEVGVATAEPYRRQGLGAAMTLALVEMALERGLRQVGWDCWARNEASGALARRAGFELVEEFPVELVILEE